ncbi:MAG: TlpA family protein disulfide reductase [Agarilytica sp.]
MLVFIFASLSSHTIFASAPNWVASTIDGKTISLDDELDKGNRVVMIFWATWCGHCKALLPLLDELQTNLRNTTKPESANSPGVTFVAFNIWEDSDPITYVKQRALSLPISVKAESIARKYGVKGTAAVFVIGGENEILYRRKNGERPKKVMAAIKQSLMPPQTTSN